MGLRSRAPTRTRTRRLLKLVKWALTAFFLALGVATLAAYIKIGIEHARPLRRAVRSRVDLQTQAPAQGGAATEGPR